MSRAIDLAHFYEVLDRLEEKLGGKRTFDEVSSNNAWPRRGVYFFFENGEERRESGKGPRVVRVGTHALQNRSRRTLWNRLSQHRGTLRSGGGNHRVSIFRLLVGVAIKERDGLHHLSSWGVQADPGKAARKLGMTRNHLLNLEEPLERMVSAYIRSMPFLWLPVEDAPGPDSLRALIEQNSIALLSNFGRQPLDPPSDTWLGHFCDRQRVRKSGLWNSRHVDEHYDSAFLKEFEALVEAT